MSFGFENLLVLLGLPALVVPPLIHLLNRRRYEVVDWGAMQFLQIGETVRRKILLEELLLMALRMGVIGLLVLGLATPFVSHPLLAEVSGGSSREIVLVLDGSYSMGYTQGGASAWEETQAWAKEFVTGLQAGDRLTVVLAGVVPRVVAGWDEEREKVQEKIARLPVPQGNSAWPGAVEEGWRLLKESGGKNGELVLVRDDQLFGWADPRTLQQWEYLGKKLGGESNKPGMRVVTVGPKLMKDAANFALAPLQTVRTLAWPGQRVTFRSGLQIQGEPIAPQRLRVEVDGEAVEDISLPGGPLPRGQVPLTFARTFATAGSHLVSLVVEGDVPREKRPVDYRVRDCLPGDNRQDLVVKVVRELPVLLVEGGKETGPKSSTFFLAQALAHGPDPRLAEGIQTKVVTAKDFKGERLKEENRPRVVVLADVPTMNAEQGKALAQFLQDGGGVLVVMGERTASSLPYYNEQFYQGGSGWLPGRLEEVVKGEASPDLKRFVHPVLGMFRDDPNCSLGQARLAGWLKVTPTLSNKVATWAFLTTGDPWIVAKDVGKGRVLLCTTALDRTWESNLPSVWEYPVLVHEMIYHLAGARNTSSNLLVGQPLRYQPGPGEKITLPANINLVDPQGEVKKFRAEAWPWVLENPGDAGVYKLQVADNAPVYYVVRPDGRESDLTPCTAEDRQKVAERVGLVYQSPTEATPGRTMGSTARQDIWWIFLLGVIALLCGEVWFTRRLALARGVR